jgi:hypothetical protein
MGSSGAQGEGDLGGVVPTSGPVMTVIDRGGGTRTCLDFRSGDESAVLLMGEHMMCVDSGLNGTGVAPVLPDASESPGSPTKLIDPVRCLGQVRT